MIRTRYQICAASNASTGRPSEKHPPASSIIPKVNLMMLQTVWCTLMGLEEAQIRSLNWSRNSKRPCLPPCSTVSWGLSFSSPAPLESKNQHWFIIFFQPNPDVPYFCRVIPIIKNNKYTSFRHLTCYFTCLPWLKRSVNQEKNTRPTVAFDDLPKRVPEIIQIHPFWRLKAMGFGAVPL